MGRFGKAVAGATLSLATTAGVGAFHHFEAEEVHQRVLDCYANLDGVEAENCAASSGFESLALGILGVGGAVGAIYFGREALHAIREEGEAVPIQDAA